MTGRRSLDHDDRGTSLILALVFVFVIGMVLVAVGGLAANALLNTSNARSERTSTGDAESAVTIAMQYLRYNPVSTAAPSCLPPNPTVPSSNPGVNAVNPVNVYCTVNPTPSQTRIVDFYACPSGVTSLLTCESSAMLHAEVVYNDQGTSGVPGCFWSPTEVVYTSCGIDQTVKLWDVTGADH